MSASDTLGSRLRIARKAAQLTLADIARHFEHSEAAIQQWERDKTVPSPEKIIRYTQLTGSDLLWVMTGTGQGENEALKRAAEVSERRSRTIPQVSLQQAASGAAKGKVASNQTTIAHFACSAASFCITIPDNSNAPRFEPGDCVVIDPEVLPIPGDMVLGLVGPDQLPAFRKYRLEAGVPGKIIVLDPLNTDWSRETDPPSKIKLLGVMTEHTKPRR
jgi:HTH-type transcriptional regulator, cell division transcriptional repressor